MSKVNFEIGEQDINVCVYSAVEKETSFKQLSKCCNTSVNYKKVCSDCKTELSQDEIYKAIEIGKDEFKPIDIEKVKVENTSLKVLGKISNNQNNEENGFIQDGLVWFIGNEVDKKNKGKTERNNIKFSYIRESLRESNNSLICVIAIRGKEHLILLKPYLNGFIGLGLYYFESIRDIKEIEGYEMEVELNKESISNMSEKINEKPNVVMKEISNNREKIIEDLVLSDGEKLKTEVKDELVNPQELINF